MYGPTKGSLRKELWEDLGAIRDLWEDPRCTGGDSDVMKFLEKEIGKEGFQVLYKK